VPTTGTRPFLHLCGYCSINFGFDFKHSSFSNILRPNNSLFPPFEEKIIGTLPDGTVRKIDCYGTIIRERPGMSSIPMVEGYSLTDRESFEKEFRHRLEYCEERIPFAEMDRLIANGHEYPLTLDLGSLYGMVRNWMGVEGLSYLAVDDEELLDEIINMLGDVCYRVAERCFAYGFRPDIGFFWEDICFKNGPLVNPSLFAQKVGPHYKRISELAKNYGVDLIYLDCDGCIDSLLPVWLENGVNVMFPIEVGTWNGSFAPWRQKYGNKLRGIGGVNKLVLEKGREEIDQEIARIKPIVEMGGYIPCLDHHITPATSWENVQYYCEKMREAFWK